jgi:uncharacterized protein YdaU (DUF1376 family)
MAKDPSFPFYVQDFLVDTIQLDDELVGAYIRILCVLWINGFCYADAKALAKISPLAPKVLEVLKDKFTFYDDGTFTNNRMEIERAKRLENREKRQKSGSIGSQKRWQNDSKSDGKTIAKENEKENDKENDKENGTEKEYTPEMKLTFECFAKKRDLLDKSLSIARDRCILIEPNLAKRLTKQSRAPDIELMLNILDSLISEFGVEDTIRAIDHYALCGDGNNKTKSLNDLFALQFKGHGVMAKFSGLIAESARSPGGIKSVSSEINEKARIMAADRKRRLAANDG